MAQKKLFFNLRRLKRELCGDGEGQLSDADIETIMDRLQIAGREVVAMEGRLAVPALAKFASYANSGAGAPRRRALVPPRAPFFLNVMPRLSKKRQTVAGQAETRLSAASRSAIS